MIPYAQIHKPYPATCDRCGATFMVMPNHPAVVNDGYCAVCFPVACAEIAAKLFAERQSDPE